MNDTHNQNGLDVSRCRRQFPALKRTVAGHPAVYFDGPAGSQVPGRVIDAIADYLARTNANHEGLFATSRESDAMLHEAHRAMADFLGADDPDTVVFGANMTSLTFAFSRALAHIWRSGDEILVTRQDHDANFTPWVLAAADAGVTVRHVEIHGDDCMLDLDDLAEKLSPRTKLVAVGCASNAVGTINPVGEIARMAHGVGALVFLDAVHYAPHGLPDVAAWDCDVLACSAYKFFGPHVGVLWGRRELLAELPAYKVRPAPDDLPGRWMTGTQNHEGIAGALAAVEYLADLGRTLRPDAVDRRDALRAAYEGIVAYERKLIARLLSGLAALPDVKVWGITDPAQFDRRVPTVSITHARIGPAKLAGYLGERGIFVWHGNFYAQPLTEALGLEPDGMVRIGLLHYNTADEVDRLLGVLQQAPG
ncbi:MAG: cysteine desulfurase-like protein [Candidatus Nealsonbacteria bacterium]|nr:cysteine desulfurase-like protein [Candidatus Nealsonbacteria bacterium]